MTKNDVINFRISKDEKDTWIKEGEKRGKSTLAAFIKDCVFNTIAGINTAGPQPVIDNDKLDIIIQLQKEQVAELKQLREEKAIIEGLRSQLAREAKVHFSQEDNNVVEAWLEKRGESTLPDITGGTGLPADRAFNALQSLDDQGKVESNYLVRPNTFKVKKQ